MRTVDAHRIENLLQMCGTYHGVIAYDTVVSVLHDVPTVEPQQWVPVTERLPMINTIALITTSKGIVIQVMYFGENMNGHKVWRSFGGEYVYWDEEVVAWMPLPEPWKGENDAEID